MSKSLSSEDSSHETESTHEAASSVAHTPTALNAFKQNVNSAQDLEQLVDIAIAQIVAAFSPDLVLFLLRDGEALPIIATHPSAVHPLYSDTRLHSVGECLCGLAASEGQAIYSGNIHSDPRCTWKECKTAGYHSFAALPLRGQEGVLGVLAVGSVRERNFAEDSESLQIMADHLGRALDNTLRLQRALDQ